MNPMTMMMKGMMHGQTNQMGMPVFPGAQGQNFGRQGLAPSGPAPGKQPINPAQFKSFLPQINDAQMNWLVSQARQQGISEADITAGLESIKKMR